MPENQSKPDVLPLPFCLKHPEKQAAWVCCVCHTSYCDECVHSKLLGKYTAHICPRPDCRGRCVPACFDPHSGNIVPPSDDSPKSERPADIKERFKPAHLLNRYYLSIILPSIAILFRIGIESAQNKPVTWWMLAAMAGLIFLMSGRYFWAYFSVTLISASHAIYYFYRLVSFKNTPQDSPVLILFPMILWLVCVIILSVSWSEFTE